MEELYSWLFIHDLEDEYARIKMNSRKISLKKTKKPPALQRAAFCLWQQRTGRCSPRGEAD
jgi:hypothetical protein